MYHSIPLKLRDRAWNERFDNPRARDLLQAAGDYERLRAAAEHVGEIQRRSRQMASNMYPRNAAARRLYLLKAIDVQLLSRCKRDTAAAKVSFKAALERYQADTEEISCLT